MNRITPSERILISRIIRAAINGANEVRVSWVNEFSVTLTNPSYSVDFTNEMNGKRFFRMLQQ
jgi:hypothetical protein